MILGREYSEHQAKFFANYLISEGITDSDALTQSLSSAKVDLNPHQVDAASFALRSPLSKGVLLADEVGLGNAMVFLAMCRSFSLMFLKAALAALSQEERGRRRRFPFLPVLPGPGGLASGARALEG